MLLVSEIPVHFHGSELKKKQRSGGGCIVVKPLCKNNNFAEWIRVGITSSCLFFFFNLFPEKCYHFIFQRYRLEHYTVSSNWLALGTVLLFGLLSLSRSVALFKGWYFTFPLCSPGSWAQVPQNLWKSGDLRSFGCCCCRGRNELGWSPLINY